MALGVKERERERREERKEEEEKMENTHSCPLATQHRTSCSGRCSSTHTHTRRRRRQASESSCFARALSASHCCWPPSSFTDTSVALMCFVPALSLDAVAARSICWRRTQQIVNVCNFFSSAAFKATTDSSELIFREDYIDLILQMLFLN